jgi:hypothetical protein
VLGACEASVMHQSRDFRLTRLPLMSSRSSDPAFETGEGVHSVEWTIPSLPVTLS